MSLLALPITHLILTDWSDAKTLVTPLKSHGQLKKGHHYLLLSVDRTGRVAVADATDLTKPVENATGHWFPMDHFAWVLTEDGKPLRHPAANDNG